MPAPFRVFEISLYMIANFLPYFCLALYPFREDFRFSRRVNAGLFALLMALELFICIWACLASPDNAPASSANLIVCALFFFAAIKAHPGKLLFILLMISNTATQISFAAKCLEGIFFPELAVQSQRWSFSAALIFSQLIFLPPFFLFLKKQFSEAVTIQIQDKIWNYLWLIPGTFYLFWFYLFYFNSISGVSLALQPICTLFATLINSGAMLIYYLVTKTVHELATNLELRTENDLLSIQNLQFENLKGRMDETRRARHDLRQHMTVLHSLCESGEYGQMASYLQDCLDAVSPEHTLVYCDNLTLNALLVYYAQAAADRGIDFSVSISLPPEIPIQDTDLCVLLGNLLENACDGCRMLPEGKRRIQLHIAMPTQGSLVFTLDNTFSGQPPQKENGRFLSSKHEGYGVGLDSVASIVNRYNGVLHTEAKDGMFCVSAVLNL